MLTCKRIRDSVSDTVYFLLITVREDKQDLEHGSSFDVEATDGQAAWIKQGSPLASVNGAMPPARIRLLQACSVQTLRLQTGWLPP